jgi:hypothetical protein
MKYADSTFIKGGGHMPNTLEVVKETIEQFQKIQKHMLIAKEENAIKTYDSLKDDYLSLKAILNVVGVNLTDIDKIKE